MPFFSFLLSLSSSLLPSQSLSLSPPPLRPPSLSLSQSLLDSWLSPLSSAIWPASKRQQSSLMVAPRSIKVASVSGGSKDQIFVETALQLEELPPGVCCKHSNLMVPGAASNPLRCHRQDQLPGPPRPGSRQAQACPLLSTGHQTGQRWILPTVQLHVLC